MKRCDHGYIYGWVYQIIASGLSLPSLGKLNCSWTKVYLNLKFIPKLIPNRVREYAENRLVLRIIRINIILWIILLVLSLGHVHTWQLTRGRWRDPRLRIGENITYIFPILREAINTPIYCQYLESSSCTSGTVLNILSIFRDRQDSFKVPTLA